MSAHTLSRVYCCVTFERVRGADVFKDQMKHKMVLTLKQRDFIVKCYAEHNSWKTCAELFVQEFKNERVLAKPAAKSAMQNIVAKWRETGSVVNKNRNYPKRDRTP